MDSGIRNRRRIGRRRVYVCARNDCSWSHTANPDWKTMGGSLSNSAPLPRFSDLSADAHSVERAMHEKQRCGKETDCQCRRKSARQGHRQFYGQ